MDDESKTPRQYATALVDELIEQRPRADQVFTHARLRAFAGLPQIPTGPMLAKDLDADRFRFMQVIDEACSQLLNRTGRWLVNVRGAGYRLMEPREAAAYAVEQVESDIAATISKHTNALRRTKVDGLSMAERQELLDAQITLGRAKALSASTFEPTGGLKKRKPIQISTGRHTATMEGANG